MLMRAGDGAIQVIMNVRIINVVSAVGFTEAGLAHFWATGGVHKLVEAKPDPDGRYRSLWMYVTDELADMLVEHAGDGV